MRAQENSLVLVLRTVKTRPTVHQIGRDPVRTCLACPNVRINLQLRSSPSVEPELSPYQQ